MTRRTNRHQCKGCGQRKALSCFRGRWAVRAHHDLCSRCHGSMMDRIHAIDLGSRSRGR